MHSLTISDNCPCRGHPVVLGGNSLIELLVYGRIVGGARPVASVTAGPHQVVGRYSVLFAPIPAATRSSLARFMTR